MPDYTITELSELTGVNRRTIHFYVQQEVLPPPDGAGLGARYSDAHLLRLRAIPLLRSRGLRLDDIRDRLKHLSAAELAAVLIEPPRGVPDQQPGLAPLPAAQTLMRYMLTPGVELLVESRLAAALQVHLPELTRLLQEALGQHHESHGGQK